MVTPHALSLAPRAGGAETEPDTLHWAAPQVTQSLPELAYQAIVQAIVDRDLQPGARLKIDALAAALGMSNTPVREALNRATAQRLVLQDNNRGFTVAPPLDSTAYHHLFEVRHLLETHAIGHTSLNDPTNQPATEHLIELADQMPRMEHGAVYSDFKEFNLADREFHRTLMAMSGNPFLITSWENLHFHLHVGRLYAGVGVIDFNDALTEHRRIARAISQGDRAAARQAAAYHIEQAEQRLSRLIPQHPGGPDEDQRR